MEFTGATIDPGIHTAYAKWENGKLSDLFTINLKGENDVEYIESLNNRFPRDWMPVVVIEDVRLFTGSAKSMASGARGNLITLSKIVGAIAFICSSLRMQVEFVNPQTWKGQLNYKQLRRILKVKYGFTAKNDHEASAYGMGLWKMGKF